MAGRKGIELSLLAAPLLLLTLGVLEVIALLSANGWAGLGSVLGSPSSLVTVTTAAVLATLLPANRQAMTVKGVVAVGAAAFAVVRLASIVAGLATGAVSPLEFLVLLVGVAFALVLALWAWMEYRATRLAIADATPTLAAEPPALAGVQPQAAPVAPQPPPWQMASTPWPRKDESDPEGTLIRPPRRG